MYEFFCYMYVCVPSACLVHACCSRRSVEDFGSLGTGGRDDCEPSCAFWRLNLDPLVRVKDALN